MTPTALPAVEGGAAYASNWEHLADELRWLDRLLHLCLLDRQRDGLEDPLESFKGLVLSEQEILRLLIARPRTHAGVPATDAVRADVAASVDEIALCIARRRAASIHDDRDVLLPRLARVFHLGPFEERSLLICLAPEIDRKYEKVYAYLQDDVTRRKPTVGLVLELLCATREEAFAARAAFEPQAPLLKGRLLQVDGNKDGVSPLLSRSLKLDDRIANYLLGSRTVAPAVQDVVSLVSPAASAGVHLVCDDVRGRIGAAVRERLECQPPASIVIYLQGAYGSEKELLPRAVCADLGLPLIEADIERMLADPRPFDEIAWLTTREAVLQPAALSLSAFDRLFAEEQGQTPPREKLRALVAAMQTFSRVTFLLASGPWSPSGTLDSLDGFIEISLEAPDGSLACDVWQARLRGQRIADDVDASGFASRFRLTPGQIDDAVTLAGSLARWRSPGDGTITAVDLAAACRAQAGLRLSRVARKVEPCYGWTDIILPDDQLQQLREIRAQAEHRHIVFGDWGFGRRLSLGKGLSALFSGPPGTGKSMAAEVIARELGVDLYKIDLSRVVSKYIGETEKNLDRVFAAAERSNAILLFDEADALFGKRSEVRDSHDRYANVEVSYLLQKMEEYEGVAILASNMRQHLDHAFLRRLAFTIHFPFPDEESRRRIWEGSWPAEAPLDPDVDFSVLAREFRLSGGNIRNIVIAAAFLAAAERAPVRQSHLLHATRREYQKLGKTIAEAAGAAS
jgi:ATPase family associated with various cellular activities (AAA)